MGETAAGCRGGWRARFGGLGTPAVGTRLLLLAAAYVIFRSAWVSDDAFITLRTVDNALQGFGLRWNIAERVQAYTHPAWMLLLLGVSRVTGAGYLPTLLAGAVVSLFAVGLLLADERLAWGRRVLAVGVLLSSKAFVDFATGGLENPLGYLLLVCLCRAGFAMEPGAKAPPRALFGLSLLSSLLLLTRLDHLLLVAPLLAWVVWRQRPGRAWLALAAGMLPLAAWEAFSLIYYGMLVPNTALAKLGLAGLPRGMVLEQGLWYVADSLRRDWVTLPCLAAGLAAAVAARDVRARLLAGGVGLYLAYLVWIGGDFMSGRFFAVPLVAAACLLARFGMPAPGRTRPWLLLVLAGLALGSPGNPLRAPLRAGEFTFWHGIADERRFYLPGNGLWALLRIYASEPVHPHALLGQRWAASAAFFPVREINTTGMLGYYAGPNVFVIDWVGLSDPLLARMPPRDRSHFRPGHIERWLPHGYRESVALGQNVVADREIGALLEVVWRVVRGPIWSGARWRAIAALNLGPVARQARALSGRGDLGPDARRDQEN